MVPVCTGADREQMPSQGSAGGPGQWVLWSLWSLHGCRRDSCCGDVVACWAAWCCAGWAWLPLSTSTASSGARSELVICKLHKS